MHKKGVLKLEGWVLGRCFCFVPHGFLAAWLQRFKDLATQKVDGAGKTPIGKRKVFLFNLNSLNRTVSEAAVVGAVAGKKESCQSAFPEYHPVGAGWNEIVREWIEKSHRSIFWEWTVLFFVQVRVAFSDSYLVCFVLLNVDSQAQSVKRELFKKAPSRNII